MHPIMRLFFTQNLCGFGISAVFTGMLLWFNVGNLGYLVTHTEAGPLAAVLLWVLNGVVFGAAQFGICLSTLPDEDDQTPRGPKLRGAVQARTRIPRVAPSTRHPSRIVPA